MAVQKPTQEVSVHRAAPSAARKSGSRPTPPAARKRVSGTPAKRQEPARRTAPRHAVRQPRFITVRKDRQARTPFPLGMILILAVITVLFLFMMMNYAELDQYNSEITELKNEVAQLRTEKDKLSDRLEGRDDRTFYEEYAVEQLGMVKADSLDKYFVTLSPEDKTVIMEYDDGEEGGFGYLLSGLAEVLKGFFPANDTSS